MTHPRDAVPAGDYCYRLTPLAEGEVVTTDWTRFGREAREYSSHGRKFSLCPYWTLTEHGTVRCELLNVEVLSEREHYSVALAKATAHFGEFAVDAKVGRSTSLSDEAKICKINLDEPDEPEGKPT
jgi:hypothetical protein